MVVVIVPRVIAVVPTYHPDDGLAATLEAFRADVAAVVIVDDGTGGDPAALERWAAPGVRIVRHPTNLGIAAALNTGVRAALDDDADFVLTVDQDSVLSQGYVAAALATFAAAEATPLRLGAVAAGSVNGQAILPHEFVGGIGLMAYAIQSGMVISQACFAACGLFDDRLVIDQVDTEFCLRVWRRGFSVAAANGTDLHHALGQTLPARFFRRPRLRDGVERTYEYHAPFRQYYITRNGLDVALRYVRSDPRWALGSLRHDAAAFVIGFAAGPYRGRHLVAAALGAAHALVRRRGLLGHKWRRWLSPPTPSRATPSQATQ